MRWNCSVDKRGLESRIYLLQSSFWPVEQIHGVYNRCRRYLPSWNQGDSRVSDLASACQEPFLGTVTLRASRDGPGI